MPSHAPTRSARFLLRLSVGCAVVTAVVLSPLPYAHAAAMTVTAISSSDFATTNAAGSKPTLTVTGTNIPTGATLKLTSTVPPPTDPDAIPVDPPLTAPATTVSADGTTWTGSVNFAHETAGDYAVELISGATAADCTCTFSLASAGPPSPGPVVKPGAVAQGSSFTLKIPDDGATPGASVSFSEKGVSVSGPAHWGTSTDCGTGRCILVPVTIAPDATVGDKSDVVVTNLPASSSDTANVGKCSACLTITAPPTIDSLDPSTLGQGAATTLTINGSNFEDAATVTFGNGLTATDKPTVTSSAITVPVKIAPDAPSPVTVTVTNPDLGTASKDLTTDPGPTIGKTSPQYVATTFADKVTLTGTNFHADAAVSFPKDSGIATSGAASVSTDGTTITVPVKVTRTTPTTADVTVTNAADKGASVCTGCFSVAVAPADVTNLGATRDGSTVSVSWTAVPDSDTGGAPITGYTVSVLQPATSGIASQTVTGTTATFTGVSSTLNYTFKVVAANGANLMSPGVVASTGGQEGGTALTLTSPATSLVVGRHVTLSGHLATADGTPVAGAAILVTARDVAGQTSAAGTTTTANDGSWSLQPAPKADVTYVASFAGDAQNATATSRALRVTVAPRVTIAARQTSPAARPLLVTGTVSPNKAGRTVILTATNAHGATKTFTATVSGASTYRFAVKLVSGRWTLVVHIASTRDNAAGRSRGLRVVRS